MRRHGLLIAVLTVHVASRLFPAALPEPAPFNPAYIHRGWEVQEGLPAAKVSAVIQSSDGYIWAGTEAGLIRFNGIKFTVFTRKSHPEMVNDDCRVLVEDKEGAIWIGTAGGLLRYHDQTFTRFTITDGLFPGYLQTICPS